MITTEQHRLHLSLYITQIEYPPVAIGEMMSMLNCSNHISPQLFDLRQTRCRWVTRATQIATQIAAIYGPFVRRNCSIWTKDISPQLCSQLSPKWITFSYSYKAIADHWSKIFPHYHNINYLLNHERSPVSSYSITILTIIMRQYHWDG